MKAKPIKMIEKPIKDPKMKEKPVKDSNMKEKPVSEKQAKKKSSPSSSKQIPVNKPATYASTVKSGLGSSAPKTGSSNDDPTSSSSKGNSRQSSSAFTAKPKILYVADSVGHSASLSNLEIFQDCRIKSARAYSSVYDEKAKWPQHNFTGVVNHCLDNPGRESVDILVMSAPTVDITNLNSTKQQTTENTKFLQGCVKKSSQNMFRLAENSLRNNPGLSKVIIMEPPLGLMHPMWTLIQSNQSWLN